MTNESSSDNKTNDTANLKVEYKETTRGEILLEARNLIVGDRNISYGSPTENFKNIGEFWTTRLKHKLKDGETITSSDVADLMALLKIARNIANPKRDNAVDLAGYAACGWEAYESENEN